MSESLSLRKKYISGNIKAVMVQFNNRTAVCQKQIEVLQFVLFNMSFIMLSGFIIFFYSIFLLKLVFFIPNKSNFFKWFF